MFMACISSIDLFQNYVIVMGGKKFHCAALKFSDKQASNRWVLPSSGFQFKERQVVIRIILFAQYLVEDRPYFKGIGKITSDSNGISN